MKLLKRTLAGISAITMLANPIVIDSYNVFAEDESVTTVAETSNTELSMKETTTAETETETNTIEEASVEQPVDEPIEKLPAPSIKVYIPDDWKNNTSDWSVETDDGVDLYYEVSDGDFPEATEVSADIEPWDGGNNLPEGTHNIRFWAIHPDGNHIETVSYQWTYHIDRTRPTEFSLNTEINEENNSFVVTNSSPIIENGGSGIKEIYYTVNGERVSNIDYAEIEYGINFSFEIKESLKDAEIIVYVVDNAKNIQSVPVKIESFDAKPPKITEVQIVNISYDDTDVNYEKPIETVQEVYNMGDENSNDYTDYIYANDSSYIKIKIDDDYNELKIKITVSEKEHEYLAEDLIKSDDKLSHNGEYYIPISQFGIDSLEVCEISVFAEDSRNSSEFKLNNSVFYDPADENDSKIDVSYKGEYIIHDNPEFSNLDEDYDIYFSKINTEAITVELIDDVGIAEYSINLNGEVIKTENFINSEISQDKATSNVKYIIPLEEDGKYTMEVTITDLAGNTSKEIKNICVDTSAPQITDLECQIVEDSTFLHYVTFGIYGNKSISLQFKVDDELSGVQDILLYWDKKESYKAEYDENTDSYVFRELPTGGNIQPRIEAYDNLGHKAVYYFGNSEEDKLVNVVALTKEIPKNNVHLIIESEAPKFELTPAGKYYVNEITGEIYFGVPETESHNNLYVNLSDNEGIWEYQVKILHNGEEIRTGKFHDLLTGADKVISLIKTDLEKEDINLDEFESGDYKLCTYATDLAGNKIEDEIVFHVDKDAPEIDGNDVNYTVIPSVIKYFTFGVFGNDTISISLDVNDRSCGIKNVYLYWYPEKNGELTKYALEKIKNGKYQISKLSPYGKSIPYIEITDNLDNTSRYFFTTNSEKKGSMTIGELILDNGSLNDEEKAVLVLENDIPTVSVTVPENYEKYQVNGETWYSKEVKYCVKAQDESSGLNIIIVKENNSQKDNIISTDNGERFKEIQQLEEIEKEYSVSEGKYSINVKAFDNAGNEGNSDISFNVDITNPEITGFQFGRQHGAGFKEETETYGFYFKENTEVRVYVDDQGTSSGIAGVKLFFTESDGTKHDSFNNVLKTDSNGTYASFEIPVGFKGRVSAEVTDNVGHGSGVINADGSIVEDELLHNDTSSVIISVPDTDKYDAENKPLYNESIPIEITVNDSFSGISQIEWSIENDNKKSGFFHIDNNGKADSDDLTILSTESNLVTSVQFNLLIDSNTNGNAVNIKLTDRSGNTIEVTEVYSIDTTAPVIQTSLENTDVKNESNYKAEQKVNITINERNFDGNEVHILLNGVEQQAIWDNDGSTVGNDDTEHHTSFTISDDGDYTYEINYTDRAGNSASFESAEITIDTQKPTAEFSFDGNYKTILGESSEELYFGIPEDNKSNVFTVTAKDTSGLDYYQISIADENGNLIEEYNRIYRFSEESDRVTEHISDEINLDNLKSGKYTIIAYVVDLAGNIIDEETNYMTFYVDIDAPEVESSEYKVVDSLLRYFTFGIFGNTSLSLSVDMKDNTTGCGIESVSLFWAGKNSEELVSYSPISVSDGKYTFTELPVNCEAVPYIEVIDYMGNRNTYYFTSVESESKENDTGNLALNEETNVILALENITPIINLIIPETYKKYNVNGETWYSGDIEYIITAGDEQSGLNRINIQENDKQTELTSKDNIQFILSRYCDETTYTYQVKDANDYNLNVYAVDNAGNKADANLTFHIDKENPHIRMFQFGEGIDNGSDFEKTTYGFYFINETEAKVYVEDSGITSGFKSVTLSLSNINGTNQNTTVSGTDLYTDENGTYASFIIPMGFKGKVTAEVVDNVEHSSGSVNADGNIIEDESIHSETSSIDIHEDTETNNTDADGIPLYNESIPLTITVSDSFSGIYEIEWSVSDDDESGIISIDNNGTPNTNNLKILSTESNLVTSVQFNISVDSNTNGNTVYVKLTDRSGNISEISKTYSIDTTAPVISAEFENNNVHNESYYTDSQTVNISITERNFDSKDVQVLLNGINQSVKWNDDNTSGIGTDSTVHKGSFEVTADGDYIYEINYTDKAGNSAVPFESGQFAIDNISPTVDISFDFGDKNLENAYYNKPRTAIFTINEHNYYNAEITVMKDGVDISDKFKLDNWGHSGDNHTQNVMFSENGYYKISVKVTDMAENTVAESSNGFFIDNDSPVVSVSVENVANGEPSNAEIIKPFVSIEDKEGNLASETITLKVTAIKLNKNNEIVSDIQTYIGLEEWEKSSVGAVKLDNEQNPNKVEFSFNNLKDDGIYTFEVTASDKAGNTGGVSEEDKEKGAKYKISVNRLGSTYEIDSRITDVSPDLRYFRNNEENPFSFKIVEYNVSQLEQNETIVKMTCDGTIVDNNISAKEETSSDKWSVYTYDFPAELMETSGKYIVKLYSVDEAGNENPVDDEDERATVTFFIDNDVPILYFRDADDKTEFMGNTFYDTDSKRVEVEVYDNSQKEAENVVFLLNGEKLDEIQHKDGTMIYTLNISSKSSAQDLSVSLEDVAGNSINSGVNNFLITTNLLALWFNNKPLFIGTIVVFVLIIVFVLFMVIKNKKPKNRF